MKFRYIDSPIGQLLLAGETSALEFLGFPDGKGKVNPKPDWRLDKSCFRDAEDQLNEYFAGQRQQFELELKPHGTEFQLSVLDALLTVNYGKTCSYSAIAESIGRPKAVRAVGAANGRNPLPIIIPCHRVVGANGSLTGFGGGLDAKAFLLQLEASVAFSL